MPVADINEVSSKGEVPSFTTEIGGVELRFETSATLFSPKCVDPGTAAMLRHVEITARDKVLDLGCGYGAVGVYAAHCTDPERVWLLDVDPSAVELARRNLRLNAVGRASATVSDGFNDFAETGFTKILCNPPYHVDFSVPKKLIEKGFNRLLIGGSMIIVCKREAWYKNKLRAVFGGVKVIQDNGYFVLQATKRSADYARR